MIQRYEEAYCMVCDKTQDLPWHRVLQGAIEHVGEIFTVTSISVRTIRVVRPIETINTIRFWLWYGSPLGSSVPRLH